MVTITAEQMADWFRLNLKKQEPYLSLSTVLDMAFVHPAYAKIMVD